MQFLKHGHGDKGFTGSLLGEEAYTAFFDYKISGVFLLWQ
jgi:hypothetical protein